MLKSSKESSAMKAVLSNLSSQKYDVTKRKDFVKYFLNYLQQDLSKR